MAEFRGEHSMRRERKKKRGGEGMRRKKKRKRESTKVKQEPPTFAEENGFFSALNQKTKFSQLNIEEREID